ncbi:MAG: hypothetical protein D6743_17060 [Calditrichaeota bacterium]|nr:MAG: hypothetical protein D6743_17060 [Calditrichota bacterium]
MKRALVASILLHLLVLLLWSEITQLDLFAIDVKKPVERDPLVFEFEAPKRTREVVETPEDAKVDEFQKDADLASDKNARARNPEADPDLDLGKAFSRGDLFAHELPTNPSTPGKQGVESEQESQQDQPTPKQKNDLYAENTQGEFRREYLVKPRSTTHAGGDPNLPKVRYDNQDSRAPDMGGLSFNTYNWDFAPYMLALKKRVEGNIFPPPAFTRLGMIQGETLLSFKIYPNGEMRDLKVIDYSGHHTLMETSVRAIEVSAPFPKLPRDFPEPYLEVTAKFSYLVSKFH